MFAGLAVIALCVALAGWAVPDDQLRKPMWAFVFLALAACGLFCWHHPEAPGSPNGWLQYVAAAAIIGVVFVSVDAVIYGMDSLSLVLDLALAGFGAVVAISGFVYSWVKGERNVT